MAVASIRESEARLRVEVAPLNSNQVAIDVKIRYLEPVLPTGEAAPTDNTWVEPTLIEEKFSGKLVDKRPFEKPHILFRGEG